MASKDSYLLEVMVEKENNIPNDSNRACFWNQIKLILWKTFTISVYSENNLGLLNRISGIFLKDILT
jgi:hypothetical protein